MDTALFGHGKLRFMSLIQPQRPPPVRWGFFIRRDLDVMMVQRQTIVHNVSDEPITVEQTDGSHITVPARGKRPGNLPSEVDFLTQSMPQDQPPP